VLLLPTIFQKLNEKTLYIFRGVNALSILVVWALYPETNQHTLEEMNLVFTADSIWNWEAEKNYKILKEENPDLVQAAQRGRSVVDPETGMVRRPSTGGARKVSLSVRRGSQVGENGFAGEKGALRIKFEKGVLQVAGDKLGIERERCHAHTAVHSNGTAGRKGRDGVSAWKKQRG
jgi:hypothetical protein